LQVGDGNVKLLVMATRAVITPIGTGRKLGLS